MMASPPIDTAVDWPRPVALSVEDISVVMPPEREITPIGPGVYACAAFLAGPPIPPRCHAAHELPAGAVVAALAYEVDGLAAGDALHDEAGVGVDQYGHARASVRPALLIATLAIVVRVTAPSVLIRPRPLRSSRRP